MDGESYEEAKVDLEKVIQLNNSIPDAYFYFGRILLIQLNYNEAINYLNRAINLDYSNASYFSERGFCYLNIEQLSSASNDFNRSIALDQSNGKAKYGLAYIYERNSDYPNAIYYYKQALLMGYDVQDRIDYLEEYESDRIARQNQSRTVTNSQPVYRSKPAKNLVLPRETLRKLKTIKK